MAGKKSCGIDVSFYHFKCADGHFGGRGSTTCRIWRMGVIEPSFRPNKELKRKGLNKTIIDSWQRQGIALSSTSKYF